MIMEMIYILIESGQNLGKNFIRKDIKRKTYLIYITKYLDFTIIFIILDYFFGCLNILVLFYILTKFKYL